MPKLPKIQNNKFAISLQYLKKESSDEVDFLHTDKDESLLQIDSIILIGMLKYSWVREIASLQCLYDISKKKLKTNVILYMQIKHQRFLKVYFKTLPIKVSYTQPALTCSKSTIETPEQGVKYVQS